jgi:hypothetical protein
MSITVTPRDIDLLETLTCRVRMLMVKQIALGWWAEGSSPVAARRRLVRLARAGWLRLHIINAHPLLRVDRPLLRWKPGAGEPDCEAVARASSSRWSQPARPTEVVVASPLAACLMGSTAGELSPLERRDHDLRLSAVYLHYRQHLPRLASRWIGDPALPRARYHITNLDAVLRDEDGQVLRVVHVAGRCREHQVERLHECCVEHDLPYELW